jgi:hypothetical protein
MILVLLYSAGLEDNPRAFMMLLLSQPPLMQIPGQNHHWQMMEQSHKRHGGSQCAAVTGCDRMTH